MQRARPAIRTANLDDATSLSRLGGKTFTETFGSMYSAEDLSLFLEQGHSEEVYRRVLSDPRSRVWIAEETTALVGFLSAGPCDLPVPDKPDSAGEIQRFYLLNDWQGHGTGGELFGLAMEFLKGSFDHIYLSVYAENYGAQRFYERQGFVKIHAYHYMVGNQADPEFIMEWRG